jgi:uncharacterized protein (TIGR02271 family)
MIDQRQVPQIIGHSVVDSGGEKIGTVGQIYLDDETNQPEWATVRTGWFGMKESFVPLAQAVLRGDTLHVTVSKEAVKEAPTVDTEGGHLSAEEERQLYRHYGLQYGLPQQQQRVADRSGQAMAATGVNAARSTTSGTTRDTTSGGTAGGMTGTPTQAVQPAQAMQPAQVSDGVTARQVAETGEQTEEVTVAEEHLKVSTERAPSGQVRMRKMVTSEERELTVPVRIERVVIERVPISESDSTRALTGAEFTEHEQVITLYEEQPRVSTEVVATERIRLSKEVVTEQRKVTGRVRQERIEIDDESRVRSTDSPHEADDSRHNQSR